MASISDETQLISVFGFPTYNNFNEPIPFTNRPATLIGFTASFLVRVRRQNPVDIRQSANRLQALSWMFVSLRLYVRFRVVRLPGWDDLFVILYLVCAVTHGQHPHLSASADTEMNSYSLLWLP